MILVYLLRKSVCVCCLLVNKFVHTFEIDSLSTNCPAVCDLQHTDAVSITLTALVSTIRLFVWVSWRVINMGLVCTKLEHVCDHTQLEWLAGAIPGPHVFTMQDRYVMWCVSPHPFMICEVFCWLSSPAMLSWWGLMKTLCPQHCYTVSNRTFHRHWEHDDNLITSCCFQHVQARTCDSIDSTMVYGAKNAMKFQNMHALWVVTESEMSWVRGQTHKDLHRTHEEAHEVLAARIVTRWVWRCPSEVMGLGWDFVGNEILQTWWVHLWVYSTEVSSNLSFFSTLSYRWYWACKVAHRALKTDAVDGSQLTFMSPQQKIQGTGKQWK